MSCGTRVDGRFGGYFEREEIARKLEREGEYRLADRVKREECLSGTDLFQAENALDRQGMHRYFDYREIRCRCSDEEGAR